MAKKQLNGYTKLFFCGLAIAGIIWNAAVLHNDVKHLQKDVAEIKRMLYESQANPLTRPPQEEDRPKEET